MECPSAAGQPSCGRYAGRLHTSGGTACLPRGLLQFDQWLAGFRAALFQRVPRVAAELAGLHHGRSDEPCGRHPLRHRRGRNDELHGFQFDQPGFPESLSQSCQPRAHRHEQLRTPIPGRFQKDFNPGLPDLGLTNLITPYGTTIFQRGTHNGLYRANWVEITHPNGEKERVEYSEKTPAQVFSSEPLSIVPKGVPVRNFILWARNTYHWDRKAYAEGYSPNDYTKARIYHWTHGVDYNTASGILESFKAPLEHRIWFNYDGQVNATFVGSSDQPTKIARTTEDGTTQLYQFEYNSLNNPTKAIDPLGRTITFIYDTNELDLTEVRQTRGGQNELLFKAAYNARHQPL